MSESNSDLNCEKGPRECEGHRWQACIIEKDSDNVLKFLGTIAVSRYLENLSPFLLN
jgi:hypothetical protein